MSSYLPSLKSLNVSNACVEDEIGGEHLYWGCDLFLQISVPEDWQLPPPPLGGDGVPLQVWVPMSGSSLHLPLMQISWPEQSLRVLHGPLHEDIAFVRNGMFIIMLKRKMEARKIRFDIWAIEFRTKRVDNFCMLEVLLWHIYTRQLHILI
jgi:hypothetical protein